MPASREGRSVWVGYLRVSTPEQAERDLSLPAQRRAVEEYAARSGQTLSRLYVEEGCSGTHMNRRAFREMLGPARAAGLGDRPRIGMQMWFHTPAFLVDMFRKVNPRLELVSSDPVMDALRMVKEPEEVEHLTEEMAALEEQMRTLYLQDTLDALEYAMGRKEPVGLGK